MATPELSNNKAACDALKDSRMFLVFYICCHERSSFQTWKCAKTNTLSHFRLMGDLLREASSIAQNTVQECHCSKHESKGNVSGLFHSGHFHSAAIAVTVFRALEVYPGRIVTLRIEHRAMTSWLACPAFQLLNHHDCHIPIECL